MAAKPSSTTVLVPPLDRRSAVVTIIGETPLIVNRMSAKARHTLLVGGRRKTAAERAEIKHDPETEFRESMYIDDAFDEHSAVKFPVVAFKAAMATAALVTPGMKKTDVQRLVYIPDEYCPIYGIPRLRMDIVRSSDMARTPDIRTRAEFAEWATRFTLQYVEPMLNIAAIATLLNNAGIVAGVGENRQEKGKGSFGMFRTADDIPEALLDGKKQREAILGPVPANQETAELIEEYAEELARRD